MHYLEEISLYREIIPRAEIEIKKIRQVLFSFFKVKEKKTGHEFEKEISNFNNAIEKNKRKDSFSVQRLPGYLIDKWIKKGMPNLPGFIKQHNKEIAAYKSKSIKME